MARRLFWAIILAMLPVSTCGSQALPEMVAIPPDDSLKPEILNGKAAEQTDWPVTLTFQSGTEFCTSTIVGPRVILTAAHCVADNSKATVRFNNTHANITCWRHGAYKDRDVCKAAATDRDIVGCTADVALCRVDDGQEPFKLTTPSGQSILTERVNINQKLLNKGMKVSLVGFGCLLDGGPIKHKPYVSLDGTKVHTLPVPNAGRSDASRSLEEYLVVKGTSATCDGDSGGAAYTGEDPFSRKIIAVSSRGNITTTSYLTSTSDAAIADFLNSWGNDQAKGAPICGVHANAEGASCKK